MRFCARPWRTRTASASPRWSCATRSTSWPSAPTTTRWRCTPCTSPTRCAARATSCPSCPPSETSATANCRWPSSSSSRWSADWDPKRYHDTHREKVEALIEEKRQGHEIVIQEPAEPAAKVVDLMEALNASIKAAAKPGAKSGRAEAPAKRASSSSSSRVDTGEEEGRTQGRQAGRPPQGVLTPRSLRPPDPRRPATRATLPSPARQRPTEGALRQWVPSAHENRVQFRSDLISRSRAADCGEIHCVERCSHGTGGESTWPSRSSRFRLTG